MRFKFSNKLMGQFQSSESLENIVLENLIFLIKSFSTKVKALVLEEPLIHALKESGCGLSPLKALHLKEK